MFNSHGLLNLRGSASERIGKAYDFWVREVGDERAANLTSDDYRDIARFAGVAPGAVARWAEGA